MSNVVYLRPPVQAKQPERSDPTQLRVALTRVQLAALLRRSSTSRMGQLAKDVDELAKRFLGRQGAVASSASETPAIMGAQSNALMPVEIKAGRAIFEPLGSSTSDLVKPVLKIQTEFLQIPENILLARQTRTGSIAFSINGWEQLGELTTGIVNGQKTMIESWAARGGQPGLRFKYQAQRPFGRVAHVAANEVTDLRAVSVYFSVEKYRLDRLFVMEISLDAAPLRRYR